MPQAIHYSSIGGPEVLTCVDVDVGEPGQSQVRIRHHAIGLNFIDVYFRTGLFPQALPGGLGTEGAGVVEAVGSAVAGLKPGDRVAYAASPPGAYADVRLISANVLVKLPDAISFEQAAAMMLRGLTAQFLLRRTYAVKAGDTVLIHAAAGGVGLIATQWAKALGATVIGTVSSDEKAQLARAHGCDVTVVRTRDNLVDAVKSATNGRGVDVVYDSVGKDTFIASLDCLRPMGMMVNFGSTSGALTTINVMELTKRGSLFFTRPTLSSYIAERADLEAMTTDLFEMVLSGKIRVGINQRYALTDVVRAHRDLESGKTTGSSILVP